MSRNIRKILEKEPENIEVRDVGKLVKLARESLR